jgi:hypothetical protein
LYITSRLKIMFQHMRSSTEEDGKKVSSDVKILS